MAIEVVSTETQNTVTAPKSATVATKPEPVAEKPETSKTLAASDTANTEDTSVNEDADTDSQNTDENEPTDKLKRKSGRQREKEKLARLESEVSFLREQAMKATQAPVTEKSEKPQAAKTLDAKPVVDDFDSHADFVEALTDWKVEQKDKAREQKQKEAQVKTEFETKSQKLADGIKEFSKEHTDFDDVMEDVADINTPFTLSQCVLDSDNGPALMYALAQDPKEYARICALPAIALAREIGKIEARLSNSSDEKIETPETKITKAPKPITPIGAGAGGAGKKTIFTAESQAEYEAVRREQMKKRNSSWG